MHHHNSLQADHASMGLMETLMLSCRKAGELIERRTAQPLRPVERMQSWMHLRACDGCSIYKKQSELIDRLLETRKEELVVDSVALEDRILRSLKS
jgi:hypothetical protein